MILMLIGRKLNHLRYLSLDTVTWSSKHFHFLNNIIDRKKKEKKKDKHLNSEQPYLQSLFIQKP